MTIAAPNTAAPEATPDTEPTPDNAPPAVPTDGKTFTQEELDHIVGERLAKQKAQFKDYDQYKTAAERLAALEAEKLTELEKAQAAAAEYQEKLTALQAQVRDMTVSSALTAALANAGAVDLEVAAQLLAGKVELDETGAITTDLTELVAELAASKTYLFTPAGPQPVRAPASPGVAQPAPKQTAMTEAEIAALDPNEVAKNPDLWKAMLAARDQIQR